MFMSALGAKSAAPLVLKGLVRLTSKILQALRGSLLVRIDPSAAQPLRSGTWVAILGAAAESEAGARRELYEVPKSFRQYEHEDRTGADRPVDVGAHERGARSRLRR